MSCSNTHTSHIKINLQQINSLAKQSLSSKPLKGTSNKNNSCSIWKCWFNMFQNLLQIFNIIFDIQDITLCLKNFEKGFVYNLNFLSNWANKRFYCHFPLKDFFPFRLCAKNVITFTATVTLIIDKYASILICVCQTFQEVFNISKWRRHWNVLITFIIFSVCMFIK